MKLIIFICLLAVLSKQVYSDDWKSFQDEYNKRYDTIAEELLRRSIFVKNSLKIKYHNAKYAIGLASYKVKMNRFGDMLPHELVQYRGFESSKTLFGPLFKYNWKAPLPGYIDWRTNGAVTAVKDQGQCGSDWAFSAIGSLEGQLWKNSGMLVPLSEQNLVDCSRKEGNRGCSEGSFTNAFKYIMNNRGIDSEMSYPYRNKSGECRYQTGDNVGYNIGYAQIPEGDEIALKSAVANIGPISVSVDASSFGFLFYSEGIFDDSSCSSGISKLNHALLTVGYGTENGIDYWIVKNSWSSKWGIDGYIKMRRNSKNQCGIASDAAYPVV